MSSTSTTWVTQGNTKAGATSSSTDSLTTGTLVADTLQLASNIIKASDGGSTITLDTSDNVTIAGGVTATGATQLNSTLTVGVDDTGYDVKFFGNTASNYMLWDTSEDALHLVTTDASTSQLIVESTDTGSDGSPDITFYRNTSSPAVSDNLGSIYFDSNDDGDNQTTYVKLKSRIIDETDGSESASFEIQLAANDGTLATGLKLVGSASSAVTDATFPGGITVEAGTIIGGKNSNTRGVLQLYDGSGGNTPGYIIFYTPNGTPKYMFVEDDGTVKLHTGVPAANSDGAEVGGQS